MSSTILHACEKTILEMGYPPENIASSPWLKSSFGGTKDGGKTSNEYGDGQARRVANARAFVDSHAELAYAPGHPFYEKLNELLEAERFDAFVEGRSAKFYAKKFARPSLLPGIYFRSLLIGYFEGIKGELGIAWRVADSLGLRRFLGIALTEATPDHSTLSRTRRRIDLETHEQVFAWVLACWPIEDCCRANGSASTRPRWKPTRRCARLCGATRARVTTSFSPDWPMRRAWKRRPAKT